LKKNRGARSNVIYCSIDRDRDENQNKSRFGHEIGPPGRAKVLMIQNDDGGGVFWIFRIILTDQISHYRPAWSNEFLKAGGARVAMAIEP